MSKKRNHRDNTKEKRGTEWPELKKLHYPNQGKIDDDLDLGKDIFREPQQSSVWPSRTPEKDDEISNHFDSNPVIHTPWGDTKEANNWGRDLLKEWTWDDEEHVPQYDQPEEKPYSEPKEASGWPDFENKDVWEWDDEEVEINYETERYPGDFDPEKVKLDYDKDSSLMDQMKEHHRRDFFNNHEMKKSVSTYLDNRERQARSLQIRRKNEQRKAHDARNQIESQELEMIDHLVDMFQQSIDGCDGDINNIDVNKIRQKFYVMWKDFKG